MVSFKFTDRAEFLASNIQVESLNHPDDYTIWINSIPIIFNKSEDVYVSIEDLDDYLSIKDVVSGREACRLVKNFVRYVKTFESRIFISPSKVIIGD